MDKSPSLILEESIKLIVHSFAPLRIFGSICEAGGFGIMGEVRGGGEQSFWEWISYGAIGWCFGFENIMFGSGEHGMG